MNIAAFRCNLPLTKQPVFARIPICGNTDAALAQLVARILGKDEVGSSNLLGSWVSKGNGRFGGRSFLNQRGRFFLIRVIKGDSPLCVPFDPRGLFIVHCFFIIW